MHSTAQRLPIAFMVASAFLGGAFLGGALFASLTNLPKVSAQDNGGGAAPVVSAPATTLPPIFQVGNVVTFGPQGPELRIIQVYGNWIYVAQNRRYATGLDSDSNANRNQFWVHVPSIADSWSLVPQS